MLVRRLSLLHVMHKALIFFSLFFFGASNLRAQPNTPVAAPPGSATHAQIAQALNPDGAEESSIGEVSVFSRATQAGPIVFMVLLILVAMSIVSWAIAATKWFYLRKIAGTSDRFIASFWDSRSLNDLNSRLSDYPYSPVREVFRNGYAELVRGSQLKEQATTNELAVSAALDNLSRALNKSKNVEKRKMERNLPILAISASASPFIGLFGTVWGIMNSFEGIARTGSASLAAVAPGISEALIATAFGLAAAIPAVIGYNIASSRIRGLLSSIDGFGSDYLNIVQRYLVSDRTKGQPSASGANTPRI
jgi:biopolymer transport protein TolQ